MLDELRTWWQNSPPETQENFRAGALVVAALLGGHLLGAITARALRARGFDALLRLPSASPPDPETARGFTPSFVGGLLVRLTVWAAAGGWLAQTHGRPDLANTLQQVVVRVWAIAAVLVTSLALGSLLARRLMDCLDGLPRARPETSRNGAAPSRSNVAGAAGAGAYVLTVLLVLLIAADLFDWPLTRTAAVALWQFAQHLLIAGTALLIGWVGARWARDLATPEGAASPEQRAGRYTALGIVAATTVLAVAVLLTSAGVLLGLAALALVGLLLWMVRGHIPDITAGLQLRAHQIREVWLNGTAWRVGEVGLLQTEVGRGGEVCRLQNRVVLQARLHGAPAEPVER